MQVPFTKLSRVVIHLGGFGSTMICIDLYCHDLYSYLQKLWRCDPSSIPRVGRTHRPASRRPAAACCSPPELLRTEDPGAVLAHLHRGYRRAAPRPANVLLLGRVAALLMRVCKMRHRREATSSGTLLFTERKKSLLRSAMTGISGEGKNDVCTAFRGLRISYRGA